MCKHEVQSYGGIPSQETRLIMSLSGSCYISQPSPAFQLQNLKGYWKPLTHIEL